ncbi:MAG TPA: hypothetical protein VFS00_21730, partial [Polyangiaceae bacterium]|nr:hypothetical protein [Polyangiaceae bacterium]
MVRQLFASGFALSLSLVGMAAGAQEPPPAGPPSTWAEPAPASRAPGAEPAPAQSPASAPAAAPAQPASAEAPRALPALIPAAAPARGPEPVWPRPASKSKTPFSIAAGGGFVGGRFAHPKLVGTGFSGFGVLANVSYALNRSLAIGIEFNGYRSAVEYVGDGKFGYKGADTPRLGPTGDAGGVRLTAGCTDCVIPQGNGKVGSGPLSVLTFGPRLQFAPDPARGLFAAVSGGVTVLEGVLPNRTAAALGAQGGYRLGLSDQVGVALEAGASAHRFSDSTALFGYGALQLQLR